jgi:hypothetical protein
LNTPIGMVDERHRDGRADDYESAWSKASRTKLTLALACSPTDNVACSGYNRTLELCGSKFVRFMTVARSDLDGCSKGSNLLALLCATHGGFR